MAEEIRNMNGEALSADGASSPFRKYAIIVAGGSGTRAGGGVPKQFQTISGRMVGWWTIRAFLEEDPATHIIMVLNKDYVRLWQERMANLPDDERFEHTIAVGGANRWESVKNGLAEVPHGSDVLVAVHDAARPIITPEMISRGWQTAAEKHAAVPAVALTDSIRELLSDGGSRSENRQRFVAVQTPQVFSADLLHEAYALPYRPEFTDDASVVENAGHAVALYPGEPANIKITNPDDIPIAQVLIRMYHRR